ncbi:MAG: hypothetical protein ACI3ZL_04515 [Candidatus Cryptobacteroides sp.]
MSNTVKCPTCNMEVTPESFSGKLFCPECGNEIPQAQPEPKPAPAKDAASSPVPDSRTPEAGASIKDGMGIIENSRNKVGAVESFSDNSVTNNTTNNISNITKIEDDTKKSVTCEISGKQVLVTSSVICPVCGRRVSNQYYDEEKLRCSECEKKAVSDYEGFYREMTSGVRAIDKELRSVLDNKAAVLRLTPAQVKESELKLRKATSGKDAHLSDIKQKDFVRTMNQFLSGDLNIQACLNKVEAYAKVTDDETVQCWYNLLLAVSKPESYRKELAEATLDEYWKIYWDFAAAVRLDKTAEAVNALELAKEKYPENINDLILAQIMLEQCQFFISRNQGYLNDAQEDMKSLGNTESGCLEILKQNPEVISRLIVTGAIPPAPKPVEPSQPAQRPAQTPQPAQRPQQPAPKPAPTPQQPAQRPQQPAPKPAQTPQPAQRTQPVQVQKPVQKPQPAPSQQATSAKGVVLNNTAGGPRNPEVSFATANKDSGKGKGGMVAGIIIAVIVAAGVGGYFLFGGKSEPAEPAQEVTSVAKPAEPAVTEPVVTEPAATEPVVTESVVNEPVVEETRPATMAEKAQTMAQQKAASETTAAPSGAGAEDYAKGMEAYGKEDYKTAYDLLRKAGTAGNAEACYQVGLMLSTGKGSVAKNILQAKVWLKKAVSLGKTEAQAALDSL